MKSVLISIQPYWVFLIIAKTMGWNISEEKTVEDRKKYPKDENWDRVTKIYCSKDKKSFAKKPKEYQPYMERFLGKVIGEFVCDVVYITNPIEESQTVVRHYQRPWWYDGADDCLHHTKLEDYLQWKIGYGWHISNLVIYEKPRELSEFTTIKCTNKKGSCGECETKPNCIKHLKGPPLSWCYVESEGDPKYKFCDAYCGVACVDGSCPKIENRRLHCVECWLYKGCEDCCFYGDIDYCPHAGGKRG